MTKKVDWIGKNSNNGSGLYVTVDRAKKKISQMPQCQIDEKIKSCYEYRQCELNN